MKKFLSTLIVLSLGEAVIAQGSIDGLVQAEKNFAAYSVAHDTKAAFLKFADSAGVVFENGKPVNAIETWTKREKRPGKLDWWPEYAEIAASGDFGYTTGPWNFILNDTTRARGYYVTVWHLNKNGEWKFLIDLGVGEALCDFAPLKKSILDNDPIGKSTEVALRQAEEKFITGYQNKGKDSYPDFLSGQSRLYRNKRCVAEYTETRYWALDSLPSRIGYSIKGSGIAASGDLGFVYGTTVINGKTDNYQRIWRRENGSWKIALEVLRY